MHRNLVKLEKLECIRGFVSDKGGKLISTEYNGAFDKLNIQCGSCGNEWQMSWVNLYNGGQWCPECGRNKSDKKRRLTYEFVNGEITANGGKLLSAEYERNSKKLDIICADGHLFSMCYANISNGQWCQICSVRKNQKRIKEIVTDLLIEHEVLEEFDDFAWLYNRKTKGTQSFDIYVPDIKLAIEYDGEQHYKPVCFGGISLELAKENLKSQRARDRLKNNKVAQHPEDVRYFIRFKYDEPISREYVLEWFKKLGIIKEV